MLESTTRQGEVRPRRGLVRNPANWIALGALGVLAASAVVAPYLFAVDFGEPGTRVAADDPLTFLFRKHRTRLFFTQEDLLYPDLWGSEQRSDWAVVFDVYPGEEPWSREALKLSWTLLASRALTSRSGDSSEGALASSFLAEANRAIDELERGDVYIFRVPAESSYRQSTGVRALGLLAVMLPSGSTQIEDPHLAGLPQRLEPALLEAAERLEGLGVRSLGIPLMRSAERLGGDATDLGSWDRLLELVDRLTREHRFETIVLGGFGLNERTRRSKRLSFETAWEKRRPELAEQAAQPAMASMRLTAVAVLFVALRQRLSRTTSRLRWWLALVMAIGGVGAGLAASVPVGVSKLGLDRAQLVMGAALVMAAVAGWFSQRVLTFDVRKELSEP